MTERPPQECLLAKTNRNLAEQVRVEINALKLRISQIKRFCFSFSTSVFEMCLLYEKIGEDQFLGTHHILFEARIEHCSTRFPLKNVTRIHAR